MMNAAVSSLPLSSLLFMHGIRQLPLFMIKAELGTADSVTDRVEVLLERGEDANRLGIGIDHGYKVIEKVQQGERWIDREVGYLKVRERKGEKLIGQPILVGRPFEFPVIGWMAPLASIWISAWGRYSGLLSGISAVRACYWAVLARLWKSVCRKSGFSAK
jgi:hypothetical protein